MLKKSTDALKPRDQHLAPEDREYFINLKKVSTSNPFGDERIEAEKKLSGGESGGGRERIKNIIAEAERRAGRYANEGRIDLDDFREPDRDLLMKACVFLFFYTFRYQFDQLITAQIRAEDTPVKVEFAPEAISFLKKSGFPQESIKHAISICYQLRRAYFFIKKSLIGRSPSMKQFRYKLWNNVFTHNLELYDKYLWNRMEDFSTLILGETGTGKGAAAMAIGRSGYIPFDDKKNRFVESFTSSFVSLNLSQFPETLIESELFGHRKGAFTGAAENHKGVFELCSPYGAILLDEIGELSIPIQIKLLQVLQERTFSPVGSHKKARFMGRVIAATNRPAEEIGKNGLFRDDFYYRLCSDLIHVPPLRRRIREAPEELDDLLSHVIQRLAGGPSPELVQMVRDVIDSRLGLHYPWHGNVRELEQCVRRVLLNRNYEGKHDYMAGDLKTQLIQGIESGEIPANRLLAGYCALQHRRFGTLEETARRTRLDSRTVKKYIQEWESMEQE